MTTAILEEKRIKKDEHITEDNNLLIEVQALFDNKKIDQSTLAKKINYSPAAISTWLKGTYKGNVENLQNAIRKYLKDLKENKNRFKTVLNFVETSVSKNIFSVASLCQYNGEIGVCFGSSGLGKTTAIKEYRRNKSGVIYVDPDEHTSARAVLKQIASQLKIMESQHMETFIEDVVKRLYGSGYLIIIDEAENLSARMFRIIRKLHDRCDGTCGILFVGTEVLYSNLLKLQGEYNYVVNRIACCAKLDSLNSKDVKMLVEQVFPDVTEDMLKVFAKETNKNARVLFNTLKRAKDIINNTGETLNKEVIESARGYLLVTKRRDI